MTGAVLRQRSRPRSARPGALWLAVDSEIRVRRARPNDADALARVYVASVQHALDGCRVPSIADLTVRYRQIIERADIRRVVLLAEFDGDILGLIELALAAAPGTPSFVRPRGNVKLDMALRPLHRLAGVGRLLTDAAERWARRHGADALMLSVPGGDAAARVFYRSCGWEDHGSRMVKRV